MQQRTARFQIVVTAVLANRHGIDGLEVVVQEPKALKEEMAYLEATSKAGSVLGSSQRGFVAQPLIMLCSASSGVGQQTPNCDKLSEAR